jgi:hypothetical protein
MAKLRLSLGKQNPPQFEATLLRDSVVERFDQRTPKLDGKDNPTTCLTNIIHLTEPDAPLLNYDYYGSHRS